MEAGWQVEEENVLCGVNGYEEKYFLHPRFGGLPPAIQQELRAICVLFAQEVGGILLLRFAQDGELLLETIQDPGDFYYDEISAGLLVDKIRRNRQELFQSLSLYYRVLEGPDAAKEGEEDD